MIDSKKWFASIRSNVLTVVPFRLRRIYGDGCRDWAVAAFDLTLDGDLVSSGMLEKKRGASSAPLF